MATIDEGPLEAPTPRARNSRAVQAPVATEKRRRALIFAVCAALTGFAIAGLGGLLGLIEPFAAVIYCTVCLAGVALAAVKIERAEA